jgi:hypothetical protein
MRPAPLRPSGEPDTVAIEEPVRGAVDHALAGEQAGLNLHAVTIIVGDADVPEHHPVIPPHRCHPQPVAVDYQRIGRHPRGSTAKPGEDEVGGAITAAPSLSCAESMVRLK